MFKPDQTDQSQLFAFSVRELVPETSDVWLYVDLFDELDLSAFTQDYSRQGEEGHEPRLILRTVFYGLTHGVVTGRKLADVCCFDSRYIVLSGQNQPSYRTFARFVIRHQTRMEELFVQVVRLAQKMGLVSLGRIASRWCEMHQRRIPNERSEEGSPCNILILFVGDLSPAVRDTSLAGNFQFPTSD